MSRLLVPAHCNKVILISVWDDKYRLFLLAQPSLGLQNRTESDKLLHEDSEFTADISQLPKGDFQTPSPGVLAVPNPVPIHFLAQHLTEQKLELMEELNVHTHDLHCED